MTPDMETGTGLATRTPDMRTSVTSAWTVVAGTRTGVASARIPDSRTGLMSARTPDSWASSGTNQNPWHQNRIDVSQDSVVPKKGQMWHHLQRQRLWVARWHDLHGFMERWGWRAAHWWGFTVAMRARTSGLLLSRWFWHRLKFGSTEQNEEHNTSVGGPSGHFKGNQVCAKERVLSRSLLRTRLLQAHNLKSCRRENFFLVMRIKGLWGLVNEIFKQSHHAGSWVVSTGSSTVMGGSWTQLKIQTPTNEYVLYYIWTRHCR